MDNQNTPTDKLKLILAAGFGFVMVGALGSGLDKFQIIMLQAENDKLRTFQSWYKLTIAILVLCCVCLLSCGSFVDGTPPPPTLSEKSWEFEITSADHRGDFTLYMAEKVDGEFSKGLGAYVNYFTFVGKNDAHNISDTVIVQLITKDQHDETNDFDGADGADDDWLHNTNMDFPEVHED